MLSKRMSLLSQQYYENAGSCNFNRDSFKGSVAFSFGESNQNNKALLVMRIDEVDVFDCGHVPNTIKNVNIKTGSNGDKKILF